VLTIFLYEKLSVVLGKKDIGYEKRTACFPKYLFSNILPVYMKRFCLLTLILIGNIRLAFAQESTAASILRSFLAKEGLNKENAILLHAANAWVNAPQFDRAIKNLLSGESLVNEDFIDRNALRPGKHKAQLDSIRLSQKEKNRIHFMAYTLQYQITSGRYLYRFTSPIVIRDSVCFFYYERTNRQDQRYCLAIFKKSAIDDITATTANWEPWTRESCIRASLTTGVPGHKMDGLKR